MEGRESNISSLKFIKYVVNKVNYVVNPNVSKEEKWKLTFDINNMTRITEEKDKMQIDLKVELFKGVEDAPFYMDVEIVGFFELGGEDDITRYEANAIAIMYPYLRAIVSTYTASANVAPVILPAINVNAMLKRKKEERKQEN